MKKIVVSLMAMGLFISTVSAQQPDRKAEIEAARIAFITKEVGLTPDEAKVFWPVYDKYQDEMEAVHKERRQHRKTTAAGFEGKTDAEVEVALDKDIALRKKEVNIQEKYHVQLKKVLPPKKLALLYNAEERFKKVMLKRLKEQQNNRQPRPAGQGGGRNK